MITSGQLCDDRVDGDGEDHDGHPREDGRAQFLVHEVAAECNLERCGPGIQIERM